MFLDTASALTNTAASSALTGGLFALLLGMIVAVMIIGILVWIYTSLAFYSIAKKGGSTIPAGIAWIPYIGPALIASNLAKMHWWPILLLIGIWIPFLNVILMIVFAIYFVIWMWKTFEAVSKPGWWAIFLIIPILNIVFLVFLGIAAWSK